MNLCLTAKSVKLLGTYFKNNLEGLVSDKSTYQDIQKELYNMALSDFKSDSLARDKELIVQHLTILPHVLSQYLGENNINNPSLLTEANSKKATVYDSTVEVSVDSFQQVVDDITNSIGVGGVFIAPISTGSYNAVAFSFAKTISQEAIVDENGNYLDNVTDPNKVFEIAVQTSIVKDDNSKGYMYKMMTIEQIEKDSTITYQYPSEQKDRPVLVVTDKDGKVLKFDEQGNVSETGMTPAFPIRFSKQEYKDSIKAQIKAYVKRDGMTNSKATELVEKGLDTHLEMLEFARQSVIAGNNVQFVMDMTRSSLGFTEINQSKQTALNDVSNINDITISVNTLGKSNSAVLLIPHANTPAKIHNNPLSKSSEETIDNLIELMSNQDLTFYGKPLSLAMRKKLITTYLQFKSEKKYKNDNHFTITDDGTKITSVVVGTKRISVSGKQFAEKFRLAIDKFNGFPYKGAEPSNYKIVEGLDNVTFQNQVYKDNGKLMQARKTEISFGLYNSGSMNIPVDKVSSIVNNEVTVEQQERSEFIKNNGYTIIVPNAEGQVRGYSSYITYASMEYKADVDDVSDAEIFFTSVSEANRREKATKSENTAADLWWENSPLNGPIKRSISKEANVKGSKFVADYVDSRITLYKGSDRTDTYHEAFHSYTQGVLSEAERKEVYDEVRGEKGQFTVTILGKSKTINYKDATNLEVEEYLATEFRKYAVNRSKYNNKPKSKVFRFFERMWNQLKEMFGKLTPNEVIMLDKFGPKVNAIFKNLYEGNIDMGKFEAPSDGVMFYSSFEAAEELDLSYEDVNLVMGSMQGLMTRFTTTALNPSTNPKDNTKLIEMMSELTSLDANNPEYKTKAKAIQASMNKYSKGLGHRNGLGYLRLLSSPATLSASLQYMKNVLIQRRAIDAVKTDDIIAEENVKLLDKVLENFGDPKAPIESFKGDNTTIIGIYMNGYSNLMTEKVFQDDIAWNDDNIEDNFRLVFDRTGAEQTVDEAANELTRQFLTGIPAYMSQGRGNMIVNRFGIPESVPFKTIISKLVKIVDNRTDLDSIYMSLSEAAVSDKEVKAVLDLLGFLGSEDTTWTEQKQWGAVWQSITKATNPLRYFSMEKMEEVTEEVNKKGEKVKVVKWQSSTGQDTKNLSVIRGQWKDNFKVISEQDDSFYTIDENSDKEERYLDAASLSEFVLSDLEDLVYIPKYSSEELYHEKRQAGVAYEDNKVRRWQADPFELLKIIGIELPETHEIRNAILNGMDSLGIDAGVMQYIKDSIINRSSAAFEKDQKIYNLEDLFKSFKYKSTEAGKKIDVEQQDVSGYFLQLQRIAQNLSDEHINFSNFNVNNDRMSEKTKHSSLTVAVSTLNNAEHYDDILDIPGMESYNVDNNPILAGSNWFVEMFNLDKTDSRKGKRNKDIKITTETLSGSKVVYGKEEKGVVSISSDELTKFISDYHLTLEGRQEIMRSEAKSTSAVVSAPSTVDGELRKGLVLNLTDIVSIYDESYDDSTSPYSLKLWDQFHRAIEGEMVRMTRIASIKKRISDGETIMFDPKYLKRGGEFFMFHLLLTPEIQNKLKNLNLSESFTLNNILSHEEKKQVETSLKNYFKTRAEELYKEKGASLKLSHNKLEDLRINETETVEDIKERSMKVFIINNFLQNVNYTTTFLGDPAIYNIPADAFHKRIAGMISTGDIFRFDDTWYNFLNSDKIEVNGFAKKHMKKIDKPYVEKPYTGHLRTGVIKESEHDSFYKEHYAKVAKIKTKAYENMEDADGQGWISMDSYRKLALSATEWSDEQEEVYQKMLNDEPIGETTATFPVKKYQFYGDVSNANDDNYGLQPKAFHKYSLAPIIPSMIKEGSPMKDLNDKMMESDMDYVTMNSGSKLSTIVTIDGSKKNALELATPDDVYTKQRLIDKKVPFTVNKIHVRNLKNQVKASEGYKGYVTLPTQWRKMIMLGVMDGNKKPTDVPHISLSKWKAMSLANKRKESPNFRWIEKFEQTLFDMEVKLKEDLLHDIGMKRVITTKNGKKELSFVGNTKKLVAYIQTQLKNEDLLPEEIEYIKNPDTGEMIDDLSYSLNAEKIEKILVTMVDKKLRRIKVNGEGLVQLSGTMQESYESSAPFRKGTLTELEKYNGTNDLKMYHLLDEKGNPVLDERVGAWAEYKIAKMEVKISLQGKFKNLLYANYNGEKIAVYKKNKDTGKSEIDRERSLDRLNEAMRDEAWRKENEEMITLSGPRIPTQDGASLEAAIIKEFLPFEAGNVIILPSEIVAKTGSDFDIDKLFLMFPNIIRVNGVAKMQRYKKSNENIEEMYEELDSYNGAIKSAYTKIEKIRKERAEVENDIKEIREAKEKAIPGYTEAMQDLYTSMEEVLKYASDVHGSIGQYKNITRNEQVKIHEYTSSRIAEIQRMIDNNHELMDKAVNSVIAERTELSSEKEVYDAIRKQINTEYNSIKEWRTKAGDIQDIIYNNGIGGLENALLDSFQERITMGNNFPNLINANDTDMYTEPTGGDTESLVDQIDRFIKKPYDKNNRLGEPSGKDIARSTPWDYRFNLNKQQENSVGMDSLGIAAITATYYALFSRMGATLNSTTEAEKKAHANAIETLSNPNAKASDKKKAKKTLKSFANYEIKFDHNTVKDKLGERIALGFLENTDGQSISTVLGQLINGYVDIAANPWIFKIEGNKENTPQLLFMVMSGMSIKDIAFFTASPLVVEYNRIKARLTGVYSDLNDEVGATPITSQSKVVQTARLSMFEKYSEKGIFKEAGKAYKASEYKEISNSITGKLGWDRIKTLGEEKERSFEEFQILSHYFEVEDMSSEFTRFTQLTKFDTQKMSSISDPQRRIKETVDFKSNKSSIPNAWFDDIAPTSVGVFNNDNFIVKLFSKYYKVRNNPLVIAKGFELNVPKGLTKALVETEFKNDFMLYLYQNSLYAEGFYNGYSLEKSDDKNQPLSIDEEGEHVTYGTNALNVRQAEVKRILFGPNGPQNDMKDMFPTDSHFLRFEIEYQKLLSETENMSDSEVLDHLYYANSYSTSTGTRIGVLYKTALYRSDNNKAMFDFRMGFASILRRLVQVEPALKDQYRLINHMRYDYNVDLRKSNMWLSEVKDPELARIYKQNLKQLKGHKTPAVAEFFKKFENMVIMQTGMNRKSKYDMAKIIDQDKFKAVIDNGITSERVEAALKSAQQAIDAGKPLKRVDYLDQFFDKFEDVLEDDVTYRLRVRGVDYSTDNLNVSEPTVELSSLTYNNVKVVNNFNEVPVDVNILVGYELFDDVTGEIDYDYVEELSKQPVYILNRKLRAPEGVSQPVLDNLLKTKFGVNNKGNFPSLIAMSLGQESNNISIATAPNLKRPYADIDEFMANHSTVAIGKSTPGSDGYVSSSENYANEISTKYPKKLATGKTKFKKNDSVWVFGSGIFERAYKGFDGGEAGYKAAVLKTFNKHHKPLISKAIQDGVETFNVGSASGVDAHVRDYLIEEGFTPVPVYSPLGKYQEYIKNPTKETSNVYDATKPTTSIYNLGLDFLINSGLRSEINSLKPDAALEANVEAMILGDISAKVNERYPERNSREYNFWKVLADNPGPLTAGNSLYAAKLEKILMEKRADYIKAINIRNQKEVIPVTSSAATTQVSSINIYSDQLNGYEDLSNFAERPNFDPLGVEFRNVEAAFQYAKSNWAGGDANPKNDVIRMSLQTADGYNARILGRQIEGLDSKKWDKASSQIMKTIIKDSFTQNPKARALLLSTGDSKLTHTSKYKADKWTKEFPRILMEVRDELKGLTQKDIDELNCNG